MLLPTKHISFSQSLLGLGYYLVKELDKPKTVDSLWKNINVMSIIIILKRDIVLMSLY